MKLLLVQAAALSHDFWETRKKAEFWRKLKSCAADTVFPAVTCTVQASLRTASPPGNHGMVSNGFLDRKLKKAFFWEQSSCLYEGERIWDDFRAKGHSVGQICFQQSIGNDSDSVLSPAPIHKHHGGMIQDFYSRPPELYRSLCSESGSKFNLTSYWGPFASAAAGKWIAEACAKLLSTGRASDLQLVYLPHLDYDMQRHGPDSREAAAAFISLEKSLELLFTSAKLANYEMLIIGDYAISSAEQAVFPNRILRDSGLLKVREVNGMLYPDIFSSRAFSLVDHQAAHVYIPDPDDIPIAKAALLASKGIRNIFPHELINHERSGELILEAAQGFWFAYPWWNSKHEAPDYASHVDIHNKPGFDPCELFLCLWPPMSVSQDTTRVKGTHGTTDSKILAASSFDIGAPQSLPEAASAVKNLLSATPAKQI